MTVAAWILLIPFGALAILNWISIFLNAKVANITTTAWIVTFISTIISALSSGIIWG